MKNCKELSSFLVKSTRAPHGEEEGLLAPTSNSSSIYYFTYNYSYGLWCCSPFYMDLVPISAELSAHLPACYSVVPILAAT